ncbi:MAG: hypothetical protein RRX93_06020 [Bacteroidales bacterium]
MNLKHRKSIKYILWLFLGGIGIGGLWWYFSFIAQGETASISIPQNKIEKVTSISLSKKEGKVEEKTELKQDSKGQWQVGEQLAEEQTIKDFLRLFSVWEIKEIPDPGRQLLLKQKMNTDGGKLILRTWNKWGKKKLLSLRWYKTQEDFYIKIGSEEIYSMCIPGDKTASWSEFFNISTKFWKSKLLVDLYYHQVSQIKVEYPQEEQQSYCLASPTLGVYFLRINDTLRGENKEENKEENKIAYKAKWSSTKIKLNASLSEQYLSNFKQIFFDHYVSILGKQFKEGRDTLLASSLAKRPLQKIEIRGREQQIYRLNTYLKYIGENIDPYHLYGIIQNNNGNDTVEISYFMLDKIAKNRNWFTSKEWQN